MTLLGLFAFGLLAAGVVGSLVPQLPGPPLSVAGVLLYWWASGFSEPGTLTVVLLLAALALAVAGGIVAPVVTARLGGVSTVSTTLGVTAGGILFLFFGTAGLVGGIVGTVFVLEYVRKRDAKASLAAGLLVVLTSFATTLVQVVLTGAAFLAMAAVVLL